MKARMTMRRIAVGLGALWLLAASTPAQDLAARVRQRLPISVGSNYYVTRGPGETWVTIGQREHMGYQHLWLANPGGLNGARLFIPGRRQPAALVTDGLVLNLPELMDYRWIGGRLTAWYPVSIGRVTARWRTPVGELTVVNKAKNPAWHRPSWAGGGVMPPGPRNPLGDRWIGLSRPGYGLHGTNDRTSIGRYVSHGCVRHYPAHIRDLFDTVWVGMPVIITYETLTIGHEGGIVYLAVFPDIYARGTNAPASARQRLATYGLAEALSGSELAAALARADGVARPILGSARAVTVNGIAVSLPIGPTLRDGTTYVPLREMAGALGAQLAAGEDGTVVLRRGDRQLAFPRGTGFTAFDARFVPLRPLVEGLGGAVLPTDDGAAITL